jgi:ABC-type transport system involved in multi-copper enzyme maturation permease subunit
MLKLMLLELKKNKLNWYLKGAIISNLIIMALIWLITYMEKLEGTVVFTNYTEAFMLIGTLVRATFIIFAAVLIGKLVIGEYTNKTISVLFTYPVKRTKLMLAKILIISGITFLTVAISNTFVLTGFLILNNYYQYFQEPISANIIINQIILILVYAVATAGMSLVPLYFGMRKKSISATIVSSILIDLIFNSNFNSNNQAFSLSSIIAIPITMAVVGVLVAYFVIRNIEKTDID